MSDSRDSSTLGFHRWLVLLSCFMTITLNLGFIFSFGNLFVDIMDTFNVSRTEASLVQSTMTAVAFGMGIFNGFIVEKLGPMWAGLIAASLSSVGLIVSFFATSVIYLVLSVGIVAGPGFLCSFICSSVTTNRYFRGKLGPVAVSVTHVGSALGGVVYPFFMRYLTEHYGLRGTLLILGGVIMNTIPFCLFWRRSTVIKPKPNDPTQIDDVITNVVNSVNDTDAHTDHNQCGAGNVRNVNYDNEAFIAETCMDITPDVAFSNRVKDQIQEPALKAPSTCSNRFIPDNNHRKQFKHDPTCNMRREHHENNCAEKDLSVEIESGVNKSIIIWKGVTIYNDNTDKGLDQAVGGRAEKKQSVMKNDNHIERENVSDNTIRTGRETRGKTVFQNVLRAIQNRAYFLYTIGMALSYQLITVVFTFIVDVFSDADLTVTDAALGLLIANLTSAFGRLLPGFMTQLTFITTLTIPIIACVGISTTALAVLLLKPLAMKLLFLGFYGIFYGMSVVCYGIVAMRICEDEYMSNGIGLTFTLTGITVAVTGPLSGWIRDETGTYLIPFLVCIGISVVALILFLSAQFVRSRRKKQPPTEVELDTDTDCVTHL